MKILTHRIELSTIDPIEFIDITDEIRKWVAAIGARSGLVSITSLHTTARVNVNESEPQLQLDMITFLKRFVARDGNYRHNDVAVDGRDNAHSHLLGLFMTETETVPVADGALVFGQWQSIFFIELDGPREKRTIHLQFMGDAA
ncbi:YjbQ family protein [Rhodomicrobium vannielii ATCC 17100]|uniref:YjbQ family protein n=1 Tax=Rhodomicrobium udaipurense TaxID=1202716 RepID=A0A8I1GIA7_9HYPH|nr:MULTISPECIES: secondary thiamine-phosphate synthase enzyme YjbQ [Rhodomicrobium]KAI96121.1 hypothetical protein T281_01795 [Rhodomicrobium udaipurense JA643]MBJ7534928.1 YjbQ family protein [Rhodomicrobium vannielii ATCC 17100]MBJ7544205.1 YjbQ family protein [Rhodomicrobium udaipurense]